MPDHPDVAAALTTGYPRRAGRENQDTAEERDKYLEDHIPEFIKWLKAGDWDVVERFFDEHEREYKDWLN